MALTRVTSAEEAVALLATRGVAPVRARGAQPSTGQEPGGSDATSGSATSPGPGDPAGAVPGAAAQVDLCIAVDQDGTGPQPPERVELGTYAVEDLRGVGLDLGSPAFDCREGEGEGEGEEGDQSVLMAGGQDQDGAALLVLILLGGGLLTSLGVIGARRLRWTSARGWRPSRAPTFVRGG